MKPIINCSNFTTEISDLIAQIYNDELYSKILQTKSFLRLNNISFLGAINHTYLFYRQKKKVNSRYTHSVWVAALAKHISNKRKYNKEIEKHLVVAALLHDIGHGPLSHSVEPVFRNKWGVGHHDVGKRLILGDDKSDKSLATLLRNNLNVQLLNDLIDRNSNEEFSDLFSSPINIDTIDGITRSYRSLRNREDLHYNSLEIAEASFLEHKSNRKDILDDFWTLKHKIYNTFILGEFGFKADAICQIYFQENSDSLNRNDLLSNESKWRKKHEPLFNTLNSKNKFKSFNLKNVSKQLSITKRKYLINKSILLTNKASVENRYFCEKKKFNYLTPAIQN